MEITYLACGFGFKFADVDYVPVSASNGFVAQVNKSVNRLPSPNSPETYEIEVQNCTSCIITGLEFFVDNTSVLSRDISVGNGSVNTQYEYYDFVLDRDQNPAFQLSLMKNDTLVKTTMHPFFNNGWDFYNVTVGDETILVDNVKTLKKVILYKGWFFGNWIKVEYYHSSMSLIN